MRDGWIKVAAGTPEIRVADCGYNGDQCVSLIRQAAEQGVKVLALPELCLTGATCADLFFQDTLLRGAETALAHVLEETKELDILVALGLPVKHDRTGKLYDCAAVFIRGELLQLIPKTELSAAERRWFSLWTGESQWISLCGQEPGIGTDTMLRCETVPELVVDITLGEPFRAGGPAHGEATLLLNLAADHEAVGRAAFRRQMVTGQSARLRCGCVYANAGEGESTTDLVFGGHSMIAENGTLLAEKRFETGLTVSEVDVSMLAHEQRVHSEVCVEWEADWVAFSLEMEETRLTRPIWKNPFVPEDRGELEERCEEILTVAALGLKKRLAHAHAKTAVVGLSGGLDSTLAVLITARAMDLLGRPRTDITAVTMPCFGTTSRTKSNAQVLAEQLGASFRTIDIGEAVRVHFRDIGQSMDDLSVTFENGQARERTQVLMDVANQEGGMVIGTGDLSELALGWATYNGDHMSMYAVNGSIPKTLMRHLVAYVADQEEGRDPKLATVLRDILDTPVSPELLPPKEGEIAQRTEELVGPYELHDFFIFYALRYGFSPRKVLRLALYALGDRYDRATLLKWLKNFYRRFFTQQFKRSCLPDGPKVGSVALSPRGSWLMPSDGVNTLWMNELELLDAE